MTNPTITSLSVRLHAAVERLQRPRFAEPLERGWRDDPVLGGVPIEAIVRLLRATDVSAVQVSVFVALARRARKETAAATLCVDALLGRLRGCGRRFGADLDELVGETMFVLDRLSANPPAPGADPLLVAAGRIVRRAQLERGRGQLRPRGHEVVQLVHPEFLLDLEASASPTSNPHEDPVGRTVIARLELQDLAASVDPDRWRALVAYHLRRTSGRIAATPTERSLMTRQRRALRAIRDRQCAA